MDPIFTCRDDLDNPQAGNAQLHEFHDLLMIALRTVLCGGHTATDTALFARAKESYLRGFPNPACVWQFSGGSGGGIRSIRSRRSPEQAKKLTLIKARDITEHIVAGLPNSLELAYVGMDPTHIRNAWI